MPIPVKIIPCGNCGQVKRHAAKGLCNLCYNYLHQTGRPRRPGVMGCRSDCMKWSECKTEQANGYTGPLPCEEVWPEDNPDLYETAPGLNVTPPISIDLIYRLNAES